MTNYDGLFNKPPQPIIIPEREPTILDVIDRELDRLDKMFTQCLSHDEKQEIFAQKRFLQETLAKAFDLNVSPVWTPLDKPQ